MRVSGKLDTDKLNNIEVKEAANASMEIVNLIQNMAPHVRVVACSVVFCLVCERYKMNPQSAFSVMQHIMNHADGRRPEFAAIRDYLRNEM